MARAHQVLAGVLETAHQIAETLVSFAGHERERQLASGEQPHQPFGVAPVGLHPVTRRPRDRPRRHNTNIQAALLGHARQSEPRRAGLIHRGHRPIELLQEHWHHALGLATQTLHAQLPTHGVEHSGDRPRLVNVEPNEGHTL